MRLAVAIGVPGLDVGGRTNATGRSIVSGPSPHPQPAQPAAVAETELITEAATLVIRQAALAEPGSHIAPERPVTLRLAPVRLLP